VAGGHEIAAKGAKEREGMKEAAEKLDPPPVKRNEGQAVRCFYSAAQEMKTRQSASNYFGGTKAVVGRVQYSHMEKRQPRSYLICYPSPSEVSMADAGL
jgi:hypothetical protein